MTDEVLRIGVHGAAGKMGHAVLAQIYSSFYGLAKSVRRPQLGATVGRPGSSLLGAELGVQLPSDRENPEARDWLVKPGALCLTDSFNHNDIDVMIDFSTPAASCELIKVCQKYWIPVVVGTTGFDERQIALCEKAAVEIPLLISPNMSFMSTMMLSLIEKTITGIKSGPAPRKYDVDIVEQHHRGKKDAPSGTARLLRESALQAARTNFSSPTDAAAQNSRPAARDPEINISSVRGGTGLNEHRIIFSGAGEQFELVHRVADLAVYAAGAVQGALYLHEAAAGIYSMQNVLQK